MGDKRRGGVAIAADGTRWGRGTVSDGAEMMGVGNVLEGDLWRYRAGECEDVGERGRAACGRAAVVGVTRWQSLRGLRDTGMSRSVGGSADYDGCGGGEKEEEEGVI